MKTINHEYYVSYEIAKLLKELGFDWECNYHYANSNMLCHGFCNNDPIFKVIMSAPTLEVAQRWLREVKNIDVFVLFEHFETKISGYTYEIRRKGTRIILSEWVNTTYEGAQEAGIKRVLEIILEDGE